MEEQAYQFSRELENNLQQIEKVLNKEYFDQKEECFMKNSKDLDSYIDCVNKTNIIKSNLDIDYELMKRLWNYKNETCFQNRDLNECRKEIISSVQQFLQRSFNEYQL